MNQDEAREDISRWLNGINFVGSKNPVPVDNNTSNNSDNQTKSNTAGREDSQAQDITLSLHMGLDQSMFTNLGVIISSNGRSKISVAEAMDHFTMPEYPATSENGIAHFIHSENPIQSDEKLARREGFTSEMSKIQFSVHHLNDVNIVRLKLLSKTDNDNNSKAYHRSYKCSGIQHCEYAHPDVLRTCTAYDRVKLENINDLQKKSSRPHFSLPIDERIKQNTEAYYHAFMKNWNQYSKPCLHPSTETRVCEGQIPLMFQRNGNWHIGCPKSTNTEPWHTASVVSPYAARVDAQYLQILIEHGVQRVKKECTYIGAANSKRKFCSFDHPQGPGRVRHHKCNVRFDLYIPVKWNRFPFLLLISRGRHDHHPSYPTKLPKDIANEVVQIIREHECLDLTARRFILSPQVAALCRKHGELSINALHQSLTVEDRVAALLRKQKLLTYPEGSSLAGVIREYTFDRLKDSDEQWIRKIHFFDEEHFLVICCTYAQAKSFIQVQCGEMDLSFKMVQGSTNLFSISTWNEDTKRINVYCYAFLNLETREAYATMFSQIFLVLEDVARSPIRFPHIHGGEQGLRTVTIDMCNKQAGGFGDYLHMLDSSREWNEHLHHMVVFCKTHVQRNFAKKFPTHPMKHHIHQLWGVNSRKKLLKKMDSICETYPELTSWIDNKRTGWILAGLTPEQSKVPIKWWMYARDHTGISESSHFQDNNFTGRKISLLDAVLKLKLHAQEMFNRDKIFKEQGISSTWRNRSDTARIAQQMRRKDKRLRRAASRRADKPDLPFNPFNSYDAPAATSEFKIFTDSSDAESQTSSSDAHTQHTQSPSSTLAELSQSKRHQRQSSAEKIEMDAYTKRMRGMRKRVEALRREREEAELKKELERLEAWKEQESVD